MCVCVLVVVVDAFTHLCTYTYMGGWSGCDKYIYIYIYLLNWTYFRTTKMTLVLDNVLIAQHINSLKKKATWSKWYRKVFDKNQYASKIKSLIVKTHFLSKVNGIILDTFSVT